MHSRLKFDIGWGALLWAAAGPPVSQSRMEEAQQALEGEFGRGLVAGLSVRTIFDAILAERSLPAGSSVVMSGINIQNMADIVIAHGLKVKAVDIDPNTLAPPAGALLRAHEETGGKLCVVAQLFGAVTAIEDAAALRDRGVMVIEDAAQAFDGRFHRGSEEVDASLFSFGPIKRRTALGGAIARFRDQSLAERVRSRLAIHARRSEFWFRRRALKYAVLQALSTPIAYGMLIRLITFLGKDPDKVIGDVARGFRGPSLLDSIRGRPPDRMIALLAAQVARSEDGVRQSVCRDFLSGLPIEAAVGRQADKNAYWLMPVVAEHPEALIEHLRNVGFDATRGATSMRTLEPEETRAARELLAHIVYLPHPSGLSPEARDRLRTATAAALGVNSPRPNIFAEVPTVAGDERKEAPAPN